MELISETDEDGQEKEESKEGIVTRNLITWGYHEAPQHPEHYRKARSEVVAVGLHEVVPCDSSRIDVVLAKRPNEGFTENRDGHTAPRVATPVHDAAEKVSRHYSSQGGRNDNETTPQLEVIEQTAEVGQHANHGGTKAHNLLEAFPRRVLRG